MSESPSAERHYELLRKYFIPDMGDHTAVGGVLSSILDRLDKHKTLSAEDKAFIRAKGLFDLCEFVKRLEAQIKAIVARVDNILHTPAGTFFPHAPLRDAPELRSIPGPRLISAE